MIAGRSTVLDIALRDLHGNRRWSWEGGETYVRRLREGQPWRGGMRNLSDTDAFTLTILPMHVPFFNSVKNAPDEVVWSAAFAKLTWQVSLSLSLSLSLPSPSSPGRSLRVSTLRFRQGCVDSRF